MHNKRQKNMIKQIITIVLLFSISFTINAQDDLDKLMTKKAPNCRDIAFNSTELITDYYHKGQIDSVEIILKYWEEKCGESEPIMRTKILLSIENDEFSESIYDSTIVNSILNYANRINAENPDNMYNYYSYYFGYVPIKSDYDNFTKEFAEKISNEQNENSLELFFCKLYSNEFKQPIKELKENPAYDNSKVRSYYNKEIEKYIYKPDFHISVLSGIWIPTGNLTLLGNHPILGFQMGMRKKKMTYNITMAFKFLKSENDYFILKNGEIDTTNHFFGGYVGVDLDREIYKNKKSQFDLLAGIAYDGFDAIKTNTNDDNTDNDKSHSINSLNLNIGFGYKYFIKRDWYISLQGKYNFVNYKNNGGTDFSGNSITVTILTGGFMNNLKSSNLNALKYYD